MNKKIFFGRIFELVFIFLSLAIMSYGFQINQLDIFSLVSFIFLIGGALFELYVRKMIKVKSRVNQKSFASLAFIYVHFITYYQRKYGDLYEFNNKREMGANIFAYFFVAVYILLAYLLFFFFGKIGLVIYLIPALTNIISFFRNRYEKY